MREPLSRNSLTLAVLLLVFGVGAAAIAISAYVSVFGPISNYSLSRSDSAWSNFGSYLGGVLGPVFSFLAFVGVLFTVWLQAKQLDTSKNQANIEEMQRVISSISTNIDAVLAQSPNKHISNHRLRDAPITVYSLIAAAGTAALSLPTDYIVEASNSELVAIAKEAISTETATIGLELYQLVWCLREYQRQDGSITVVDFYKQRYNALVCWLDAMGNLNAHPRVQEYFKPKEFRQFLSP